MYFLSAWVSATSSFVNVLGSRYAVYMTATRTLTEAEINEALLYRDALILVLNKPSGIAVHVTSHDIISLDQSFHYLQFGLPKKPELAHRLDRGTSGCLVLGRHRQALIKLGKLFEKQRVNKTYRAICIGVPKEPSGIITRPILKSGVGSKWKMSLDEAGQAAVTEYRVLRSWTVDYAANTTRDCEAVIPGSSRDPQKRVEPIFLQNETSGGRSRDEPGMTARTTVKQLSEIEFSPKTGRTHQIRLHAAFALGCPVVGDPFYAPAEGEYSAGNLPMMLHAETVEIPLQQSKLPIIVSAPLPEHMETLLAQWGE